MDVDYSQFGNDAEWQDEQRGVAASLPKWLIVHHSVTPRDLDPNVTEKSIENNHKARGFPMSSLGWHIGYNYIIYGNGEIRQYRRDGEEGAHTVGRNFDSLGICIIGSFDVGQETPSQAQITTLKSWLKTKSSVFNISPDNIVPHRRFANKTCYGSSLSDTWAKDLLTNERHSMFFQVTGNKAVWIYYEGAWIFVANENDWKKTWPNAALVSISQADFDKWPKAINTLK